MIAKSYDFIRTRCGSYMSLVKNAVDPTKGDLDKFEIRRRIRSYVKNKPKGLSYKSTFSVFNFGCLNNGQNGVFLISYKIFIITYSFILNM